MPQAFISFTSQPEEHLSGLCGLVSSQDLPVPSWKFKGLSVVDHL